MKDLKLEELLELTKSALDKANRDLGFVKPIEEAKDISKSVDLEEFDEEKHVGFIGIHPKQWGVQGSYEYNDLRRVAENIVPKDVNSIQRFKAALQRINDVLGVTISERGDVVYGEGKASNLNEVFSSLQISNVMYSIINNQSAQSAGKIFETFIAALIGGFGTNNDDRLIEDLKDENGNPVSLKLIVKETGVAGSIRNLARTLATDKKKTDNASPQSSTQQSVVYLVCVKSTESDPLSFKSFSVTITPDNFFNFIANKSNLEPKDVIQVINMFPPVADAMQDSLKELKSMVVNQVPASKVSGPEFDQPEYKKQLGDAFFAYATKTQDPAFSKASPPEIEQIIVTKFNTMLKSAKESLQQLFITSLDPVTEADITSLKDEARGPFVSLGRIINSAIAETKAASENPQTVADKYKSSNAPVPSEQEIKQTAEQILPTLEAMKSMRDGINNELGDAFTLQKNVSPIFSKADQVASMRSVLDKGFLDTVEAMKQLAGKYPQIYGQIFKDPPDDFMKPSARYKQGEKSAIYTENAKSYIKELYSNYNRIANDQYMIASFLEADPEIKKDYELVATGKKTLQGNSKAALQMIKKQKEYAIEFQQIKDAMQPLISAYTNVLTGGDFYTKERTKAIMQRGEELVKQGLLNKEYKKYIDEFWQNKELILQSQASKDTKTQFGIKVDELKTLAASIGANLDINYPTVLVGSKRLFNSAKTNSNILYDMIVPVFRDLHQLKNGMKKYFIYNQVRGLSEAQVHSQKLIDDAEKLKAEVPAEEATDTETQEQPTNQPGTVAESKKVNKQVLTDNDLDDILKMIL